MELKSTVGLNKTIEDIKKGTLVPVYLIFGDEDYLVKEAAQRIIDTILPGKGRELNLETREGDEEDWDKIIQSLNTVALFGSGRVVAVKDTKVFFSKFTSEDMLEKCRERFKAGDLNEAVRIYRVVLGYKGLKDIKVGQTVVFTVDAFGSKEYPGIVNEISPTSNQGDIVFNISGARQEMDFNVKVRFDEAQYPELKNGMSAKLWIYK